jgi:hypothetical protein
MAKIAPATRLRRQRAGLDVGRVAAAADRRPHEAGVGLRGGEPERGGAARHDHATELAVVDGTAVAGDRRAGQPELAAGPLKADQHRAAAGDVDGAGVDDRAGGVAGPRGRARQPVERVDRELGADREQHDDRDDRREPGPQASRPPPDA